MTEIWRWPRYAELLSRWIDESGLSLREIADRCTAAGQPVTYSYISKLRAGNADPPSKAITRAIATALGKPPALLELIQDLEGLEESLRNAVCASFARYMDPNKSLEEQFRGDDPLGTLFSKIPRAETELVARRKVPFFKRTPPPANTRSEQLKELAPNTISIPEDTLTDVDYVLEASLEMSDLGILVGDLLMIKHGADGLMSGSTVLVQIGDQIAIRHYYEVPNGFKLEPSFIKGVPIDPEQVQILGVVRNMIRPM